MERLSCRRVVRLSWPGFLAVATVAMTSWRPIPTAAQAIIALPSVSAGTRSAGEAHDIPPNLVARGMLRGAIETMWRESATFKAQCARLRAAPSLLVEVRFGNRSQLGGAGARTRFVRERRDHPRAEIYVEPDVRSLFDLVELIAHELEHVIEQLDEVELIPAAPHGIFQTARGDFETARAIHIGRKITREVNDAMTRRPRTSRR
jgi:hypothetical protein